MNQDKTNEEQLERVYSNGSEYEIHKNFIVARFAEGIDHGLKEATFVRQLLADKFQGPFGFIADRRNSYSIHPEYIEGVFEDFDNFKCIAWVTYASPIKTEASKHVAAYFPNDVLRGFFDTLPEATYWVTTQINQYTNLRSG
ncbi:hypothetical protein [Thalassotalea litorea]|uniref:hypothetical protein n=1 Tax=Thalassotalea litorea TaxID=2020715 RepID=UPI003734E7A2